MSKAKVAVVVGSQSDLEAASAGVEILKRLEIEHELHIYSAHRTPKQTLEFAKTARQKGFKVLIVGAGMAAHLAGVIAAHTLLPVIGVPIDGRLEGLDALLSTVQMPGGIPVATVTIGRSGFVNAALLAAEILALEDEGLSQHLKSYRQKMMEDVLRADQKLNKRT